MAKAVETLQKDRETFSSIMSSVPSLDNSSDFLHDMSALRDEYFSRIPENCKKENVRSLWRELWASAMLSLNPEQMQKFGEAFVFAAYAHRNQLRKSGDP